MPPADPLANLSTQLQLLLAQAVHQVGSEDWSKVADLLKGHPLTCANPGSFLKTAKNCSSAYAALLASPPTPPEKSYIAPLKPSKIPPAPSLLLARTLYSLRISELHSTISSEEAKFRILNAEIEEIKRGEWDEKLGDPERRQRILSEGAFGDTLEVKEEEMEVLQEEMEPEVQEPVAKSPQTKVKPQKEIRLGTRRSTRGTTELSEAAPDRPAESTSREPKSVSPAVPADQSSPVVPMEDSSELTTKAGARGRKSVAKGKKAATPVAARRSVRGRKTDTESVIDEGEAIQEKEERDKPNDKENEEKESTREDTEAPQEEKVDKEESAEVEVDPSTKRSARPDSPKKEDKSRPEKRRRAAEDEEEVEEEVAEESLKKRQRTLSATISEQVETEATPAPIDPVIRKQLLDLTTQLTSKISSSVFREPVRTKDEPSYATLIKHPMDLKSLSRRIREGHVTNVGEWKRDVCRMLANAVMYNAPGSEVERDAKELLGECDSIIALYMSTHYHS